MLRYRSVGTKEWEKHQFLYPSVLSATPVQVQVQGEPCQNYEFQLRHKKLELKLPEFKFGPENSVKSYGVVEISSNSVKIGWSGDNLQCASGFRIRYFLLTV